MFALIFESGFGCPENVILMILSFSSRKWPLNKTLEIKGDKSLVSRMSLRILTMNSDM